MQPGGLPGLGRGAALERGRAPAMPRCQRDSRVRVVLGHGAKGDGGRRDRHLLQVLKRLAAAGARVILLD